MSFRVSIRPGRKIRPGRHSRKLVRLREVRIGRRAAGSHQVAVRLTRRMRQTLSRSSSRGTRMSVRVTIGSRSTTVKNLTFRR